MRTSGGDGKASTITGTQKIYGGGGGGAVLQSLASETSGNGGAGGGGKGEGESRNTPGSYQGFPANDYGGGGGGSLYWNASTHGGTGYRGVVILKFHSAPV